MALTVFPFLTSPLRADLFHFRFPPLQAALLLEAIAGYDGIDDRQLGAPCPANVPKYSQAVLAVREKGVAGMKIGVLREGFMHESLDKAVERSVRAAISKFEELGAVVEEVSCPLCVSRLSPFPSPFLHFLQCSFPSSPSSPPTRV